MPDAAAINLYREHSGRTFNYFDVVADRSKENEALKITDGAHDIVVEGNRIDGADEDCADVMDKAQRITVRFNEWWAHGKYVVTAKGGCHDLTFAGEIKKHGTETDVDIGNAVDPKYSQARTTGVKLKFWTRDGSPVRVSVKHGHRPIILNPEQRYEISVVYKGWFGRVYPLLKKLAAIFGKTI